jgi:acyl dehydratase
MPYFEDLSVGQLFTAPAYTLTEGRAAVHQAIVGDRSAVTLDERLGRAAFGYAAAPAGFVIDVAIGQSTVVTRHVKANLFYRGLQLHRLCALGDTLSTTTEIVGLRENRRREGRAPTGLAALRIRTVDQEQRPVLDFLRCAMLPLRAPSPTGHADDLDAFQRPLDLDALARLAGDWDLTALPSQTLTAGDAFDVDDGDVVSAAPELARLTANIAAIHHDRRLHGRRLVYGGHTIGLAAHQAHRALPSLVLIGAWFSCDHTGPVYEDDTLTSRITVEALDGPLARLHSIVTAHRDEESSDVLDWRYAAIIKS